MVTRRTLLKTTTALAALPLVPSALMAAKQDAITRAIPSSGEQLPAIGMGSSRTFDAGGGIVRKELSEVLQLFFNNGGTLIDSSPMYGRAEEVLGDLLREVQGGESLFAATKVWTDGKESGIQQMGVSARRMRVEKFDLMQIHNLRDWRTHIATLKEWKAEGKVRYIGITTSHGRFHDQLFRALQSEPFDFVQLSYSLGNREVEKRLLPLAQDKGIATLINRPFQRGEMFRKVKNRDLPEWAAEIDCVSWGQFFLKFILSHPAVTCIIPATGNPHHMSDNMAAGFGGVPDAKMRMRMIEFFEEL